MPGRGGAGGPAPLLGCALALAMGAAAMAGGQPPCDGPTPLRTSNLDPFHLAYGLPPRHGTCIIAPGMSEVTVSLDMASHMTGARSRAEQLLVDGETHRQTIALRSGLGNGWEGIVEVSAVSHTRGTFDGFIEDWHDFFGLPQGGRDATPHGQLALVHTKDGVTHVDVRRPITAPGDIMLGLGRKPAWNPLRNDGLALRGGLRLPTGDPDELTGSGRLSASIWAETSGRLPGQRGQPRTWLYGASLGVQTGTPPLSGLGGRVVAFGHLGVTWRPLDRLSLTAQLNVNSTPYGRSALAPLSGPAVMLGVGGAYRISPSTTLEISVSEDDGWRHAAHDFGVHTTLRWRM